MKPRLLFIINRFVIGGQASDTMSLLYHLRDRYDIRILAGKKEADEIEPLFLLDRYPGLEVNRVNSLERSVNPLGDLVTLFRIFRFIRKFGPHIVHTHGAKAGLFGRLAAHFSGVPVIVHTFHGHLFHSYFNRLFTRLLILMERFLGRLTNAAIALSSSQKLEITEKFRVFPVGKVHIIPLGIDLRPETNDKGCHFREQFGLSAGIIAIAIVSRIVPIKNHLDFLKIACKILKADNKRCYFFIIGDGNKKEDLIAYLKENDIVYSTPEVKNTEAKVIFTSWLSDMVEVLQGLDIVVLTSLNEGTPVSLIEAQLSGKPVVAYDVGGVKDTMIDGVSGYLIKKGDIETFAAKLLMLVNDSVLRQQMGEKGAHYCKEKFSNRSEVDAIDALYKSLLSKKSITVS